MIADNLEQNILGSARQIFTETIAFLFKMEYNISKKSK